MPDALFTSLATTGEGGVSETKSSVRAPTAAGNYYVVAHRGFGCSSVGSHSVYPENSIASIRAAVEHNVDAVEIDVWLSRDGVVVVMHDEHLGRTAVLEDCRCLANDSGGTEQRTCVFCSARSSIEQVDWADLHSRADGIKLKRPWKLCCPSSKGARGETNDDPDTAVAPDSPAFSDASTTDKPNEEDEQTWYLSNREIYTDPTGKAEKVPTLREVLLHFHDKVKFNVELKGNNYQLGFKVLQLCEEFPGAVLRISSFSWIAPQPQCVPNELDYDKELHSHPNGLKTVDLLEPIINNEQNVPLALLFNDHGKSLPSAERMVECLDKYNADWVHIRHNGYASEAEQSFRSDGGSDVDSSSNPATADTEESSRTRQANALKQVVRHLRLYKKKVMTFWPQRGEDRAVDIHISIDAGVSAICPNDAPLVLDILKKRRN